MDKAVQKLILAFVMLILGAVLIVTIATEAQAATSKTQVVDEAINLGPARDPSGGITTNSSQNFTLTNAPSGWKTEDCPLSSFVYGNSTTAYTEDTDYILYPSTGVLQILNSSTIIASTNSTLADYKYCPDDYLNSSFGRTGVNLVPGFFALMLLIISLGLFYSFAKDMDWM